MSHAVNVASGVDGAACLAWETANSEVSVSVLALELGDPREPGPHM